MAMVDDPMALVWYGANHMISYDTRMESEFNLTSVAGWQLLQLLSSAGMMMPQCKLPSVASKLADQE